MFMVFPLAAQMAWTVGNESTRLQFWKQPETGMNDPTTAHTWTVFLLTETI
jgi:hypothetical protein